MFDLTFANARARLTAAFWSKVGNELAQEKGKIEPISLLSADFAGLLRFRFEGMDTAESRMYSLFSKANTARVEIRLGEIDLDNLLEDLDYLGLSKRTVYSKGEETFISLPYKDVKKAIEINQRFANEIGQIVRENLEEKTDLLDPGKIGDDEYQNQLSVVVMAQGRTQLVIMPAVTNHSAKISTALDGAIAPERFTVYQGNPGHHINTQELCDAIGIRNLSADLPAEMAKKGDLKRTLNY